MSKYYVCSLVDPTTKLPFYIGKGKGKRAFEHLKKPKKADKNLRKLNYISELRSKNLEPIVVILFEFQVETTAYEKEESLIKSYGRRGIDR